MLENFVKIADMPTKVIEKYSRQVPEEMVKIWEEDGLGSFVNGYLKVINPDDYMEIVKNTYFRGESSIPVFATAFGDIIVYTVNGFLDIIYYKENDFDVMTKKMSHFIRFLADEGFLNDYFEIPLYQEAVNQLGELAYNQCFGFVPLLALGGKKSVSHMDKVGILEHLELMTQLTGGVGLD